MKLPPPHRLRWLLISMFPFFTVIILLLIALIRSISTVQPPSGQLGPPLNLRTLSIPNIEVKTIPDYRTPNKININESIEITVTLSSEDNRTFLSQLQGNLGQDNSSLQQLLGNGNQYRTCIYAQISTNSNQLTIEPTQIQEYSLDQTSIPWSWIITPTQTGVIPLSIHFIAEGKSACATDQDPSTGPYSLQNTVLYSFNVINPNSTSTSTVTAIPTANPIPPPASNPFFEIYNELGLGTIITGALTTLLAAFVTWIFTEAWRRRTDKIKAHTTKVAPSQPDPPSDHDSLEGTHHDQDQHTTVP